MPEASADGEVREAYRKVRTARGEVANIYQLHGVHPQVMTAHLELYRELMLGHSELTLAERDAIPIAVSAGNDCRY